MNDVELDKMISDWGNMLIHNWKPIDSIINIIETLIPHCGEQVLIRPRRQLSNYLQEPKETPKETDILLLVSGYAFATRSDGTCIGTVVSPAIVGLVNAYSSVYKIENTLGHYVVTGSECKYYKCPMKTFIKEIESRNLWHDIARIMVGFLFTLETNNRLLLASDAHDKVLIVLMELYKFPLPVRNKINAQEFIQQRTGISRSMIMKTLSAMKDANEIMMSRGRLININNTTIAHNGE